MNNKGFTLIELLGVLVVLVSILLIALPNIASSFERQKNKINEQRIETIKSAGELYASRYKKNINYDSFLSGSCGISIQMLLKADMITDDELKKSNGDYLYPDKTNTIVVYNKSTGKYNIQTSGTKCTFSS